MTQVVLVAPADPARRSRGGIRLRTVVAMGLFMAAVFGAVVWVVGLSPLGFDRFALGGGARSLRFDVSGEFVVFEQRDGAASPQFTSLVIQGPSGQRVPTYVAAGAVAGVVERDLPFFDAWEVARFEVSTPGVYTLYAVRSAPGVARPDGTLAVTSIRSAGWMGSWAGFAAFAVAPALAGMAVLLAPRRHPRGEPGHRAPDLPG